MKSPEVARSLRKRPVLVDLDYRIKPYSVYTLNHYSFAWQKMYSPVFTIFFNILVWKLFFGKNSNESFKASDTNSTDSEWGRNQEKSRGFQCCSLSFFFQCFFFQALRSSFWTGSVRKFSSNKHVIHRNYWKTRQITTKTELLWGLFEVVRNKTATPDVTLQRADHGEPVRKNKRAGGLFVADMDISSSKVFAKNVVTKTELDFSCLLVA